MINTCAAVDPDYRSARRTWSIRETGVGRCYDDDDDDDDDDVEDDGEGKDDEDDDDEEDDGGVMVLTRTED